MKDLDTNVTNVNNNLFVKILWKNMQKEYTKELFIAVTNVSNNIEVYIL